MKHQKFRVTFEVEYMGAKSLTLDDVKNDLSLESDEIDSSIVFSYELTGLERA